jgi:hypothetical protein
MTRSPIRSRRVAAVLVAMLAATSGLAASQPASAAPGVSQPARAATPMAEGWVGTVSIEQGQWTAVTDVTLRVQAPPNNDSMLRISNDGATWAVVPLAAEVSWSLIDAAAGGTDEDGPKTVTVSWGDGTSWGETASATVILDRQPPATDFVEQVIIDGRLWRGWVDAFDWPPMEPHIAATRYSLDAGASWEPWASGTIVDLWNAPGAGAWAAGDHSILLQFRDAAGNLSEPVATTADVRAPQFFYPTYEWNLPGVVFETPSPAITGQPFTIRVVYPEGYTLPANAWCQWILTWGNDDEVFGPGGPTWGELFVERSKANNACAEWTFTVPYRAARQFAWKLFVGTKNANTEPMELVGAIIERGDGENQIFRALDGPHDERFASSSIPFAYVLPETTISQAGDRVTYRLHTVGTSVVPQSGMWWTNPLNCYLNPSWSQTGGDTFTYRPNCDGPWVTGWTGVMLKGYMRSQYDPLVDGRAPKVQPPLVKLRSAPYGSAAPGTVSWTGRDRGSGVRRYVLEMRRNNGAWRAVTLPSRLTRTIQRSFATTGTYRFRVKARDRVGNWSPWTYGPTIRARARQESSSAITWGGPWATVRDAGLSGGSARATVESGASARITMTVRNISWVSRRGPGRGLAQVWVDGALAATVDLGAEKPGGRTVVFSRTWTSFGKHTLRIVSLGTAGRPLVEVDAFLVVR